MVVASGSVGAAVELSDALVREVDAWVGLEHPDQFVQEAVAEKVGRYRRLDAFGRFSGSLADANIPEWETSESTAQWVHDLRYHPATVIEPVTERVG